MLLDTDIANRWGRFFSDMRNFGWLFVVAWTLVIGAILYWDFQRGQGATRELALSQARAHYNKDLAFRLWATDHQRIYVPITEKNQPDPNLAHLDERDLTTPAGRRLTMINPARIVRQLNDDYGSIYGVVGRIVSLQPFRTENSPDDWERSAIAWFQSGGEEMIDVTEVGGEPILRLMQPLKTVPGCLTCHAQQGYRVGLVSGGVGVTVPMGGLLSRERQRLAASSLSLGMLWLLGLVLMRVAFRFVIENQAKRDQVLNQLTRSEARKASIMETAHDSIVIIDDQGCIAEFNRAAEQTFGYRRADVLGRALADVLIPLPSGVSTEAAFNAISAPGSHVCWIPGFRPWGGTRMVSNFRWN